MVSLCSRLLGGLTDERQLGLRFGANGHLDSAYDLADAAIFLSVTGNEVTAMVSVWTSDSDSGDPMVLRTGTVAGMADVPDAEIERHIEIAPTRSGGQRDRGLRG